MPKRPCARPGCRTLVERGYCEGCAAKRPVVIRPWKRLYGWKWQKYTKRFLTENPECIGYPKGVHGDVVTAATDVDHIVPHRGDEALFWDAENHQGLCHACHSSKTATQDGGFRGLRTRKGPIERR